MPAAMRPKQKQIDALMEKASRALADTDYFEAEGLALRALTIARSAESYGRMAQITLPLQEARRQRVQLALDAGAVRIVPESVTETFAVEPGPYLVQPPQVGADARRLRLLALEQRIPVLVLCREPRTQLRLCPVVAIAPGTTVRTKVDPPADPEAPDLPWLVAALETLGDHAIEAIDTQLAAVKRVDRLLGCLDALPEHEHLHQALADACRDAEQEAASGQAPTRKRR